MFLRILFGKYLWDKVYMRWAISTTSDVGSPFRIANLNAHQIVYPSQRRLADDYSGFESTDNLKQFGWTISDPEATPGATATFQWLARRIVGFGETADTKILFGQENGTWQSAVNRFTLDITNTASQHDAMYCDFHRTTGLYPSALSFDLFDAGQTMDPSNGVQFSMSANTYIDYIAKKLDKAWKRGYCHVSMHWKMPWPLQFGFANNEANANSSFVSTNPTVTPFSSDIYHAKWIYQKYTGKALGSMTPAEFSSGELSNVVTDMCNVAHPRNARWNRMLDYVRDAAMRLHALYPTKGIELRLLHQANNKNTGSAFWWNLYPSTKYVSLYQYSVNYLRSQNIHNLLYNYNLEYVAPSGRVSSDVRIGLSISGSIPYTKDDIAYIYACQTPFISNFRSYFPGSQYCDLISLNLTNFNVVNNNSAMYYVGEVQRIVMECQHYKKIPCISEVSTGSTDINNSNPAISETVANFWPLLLTELVSNKYTSRISHIIANRNRSTLSAIPLPHLSGNLTIPAYKDFREFFFQNDLRKHFYLQTPKIFTLATQPKLSANVVFDARLSRDFVLIDGNFPIYWPRDWKDTTIAVEYTSNVATVPSMVFKDMQFGYTTQGSMELTSPRTTANGSIIFHKSSGVSSGTSDRFGTGFTNVGQHPPFPGFPSFVSITFPSIQTAFVNVSSFEWSCYAPE
jgi:hypothetical protein